MTRTRRVKRETRGVADMTVREFARVAHEMGGKASFAIKPARHLSPVLGPRRTLRKTLERVPKAKQSNEWLCGYAAALANIDRQHDRPSMVRDAMVGDGLTVRMLKDAGVEEYDLAPIRKAMGR